MRTIVRIAGDGVGPELVAAGSRLVEATGLSVHWLDMPAGLGAYHQFGATAPAETIEAVRHHGAALKGPFATPSGGSVRSANHYLRRELDLYACIRPIPVDPSLPILLVRENVEDMYAAIEWWAAPGVAQAVKIATRRGCERIAETAFALARRQDRRKVTLVHKANNLKLTEGLFLEVAREVSGRHPEVAFDDMLADTACSTLVLDPGAFDVILTSNTFGDLLSNLGAAVAGSLGLVGSLNSGTGVHIAEAAHGDAGHLANRRQVNPIAFFESVAMLLSALGEDRRGEAVSAAILAAKKDGPTTLDLGGLATTDAVTDFVCDSVTKRMAEDG
ncbi:isocitrate/isopropylmalate dehydrogenase family protein [Micromonospora sp. ANENR4]|uniref:isocitrate/isopropylmalate family dehydrogenase n=1 Tax=Micromonospora sp. ANENR4 TaxID=2783662 RepID=UPI00188FBA10|nr:isocitrate/isopropylmalate dehydrogenase family protein [Micromonospora sp. ANENR4]